MYKKIKAGQYSMSSYGNFEFILENNKCYESLTKEAQYLYLDMLIVILANDDDSYIDHKGYKYIHLDVFVEKYLKQEFEESYRIDIFNRKTLANCIKELKEYKLITLETSNDRDSRHIVVYLSDIDSYHCEQLIQSEINNIKKYVSKNKLSL